MCSPLHVFPRTFTQGFPRVFGANHSMYYNYLPLRTVGTARLLLLCYYMIFHEYLGYENNLQKQ